MSVLAIAVWLHLFAPDGCGVPVPQYGRVVEVAPMPRPVPVMRVPERQPPRIVFPPKKKGE